jgi:transposase
MSKITRVGVDLAKNVIQVHAVDAAGKVVTNRALKREKFLAWFADLPAGCLVAMEACTGAHHWARKLNERGFDARIIPAQFVTPYRIQGKTGKNDANDAAAVCECIDPVISCSGGGADKNLDWFMSQAQGSIGIQWG